MDGIPPKAPDKVLSTLNEDGSRIWLDPKLSKGRFLYARALVGYGLIAIFTLLPFWEIGGKPSILLDLAHREFTFFGATFLPTDTLLLVLLLLTIFVGIFLVTALFGRVWCGWGCPQTVYMELVFRPLERASRWLVKKTGVAPMAYLKYPVFLLVALHLANTFLAYFVGADSIAIWVWQSPFEHPASFTVVAGLTGLMFIDFAYFREQMCVVACPYARLQSVLLDKRSLIVGYDEKRGEPRGPMRKSAVDAEQGDCIDCKACVKTCPTGIDIRQGLQLECIGCAQCIDACDEIMVKIGKPTGLVRYSSQEALESGVRKIWRARVFIYPAILVVLISLFLIVLAQKNQSTVDLTVLRGIDAPFVVDGDDVRNQIRIRLKNRTKVDQKFTIELLGAGDSAQLIAPENPVFVKGRELITTSAFVVLPKSAFTSGKREVTIKATGEDGYTTEKAYRLLGPRN